MNSIKRYLFLALAFAFISVYGQRSKNGARTITALNTVVNEYTSLTANASAGTTTISVAASSLNANGRFTSGLSAGDLIMIIQLQGATINGTPSGSIGSPNDSTWGAVTAYNNAGKYEFAQVNSVPSSTSITIDCGLANDYTSAGKVVVVRVPRYSSLTVNTGASLTCDAWNGTIGGIVAIEVNGNTTVNGTGQITATGKGFRGGQLTGNDTFYNLFNFATISTDGGGEKGEGIAGYKTDYNAFGGSIGRGAPANGGGGGNGWNAGGAGGANGGDLSIYNGRGNPDLTTGTWAQAWNLESGSFSTNVSSGGGRGGYSASSSNQNALTVAPGNSAWGGDYRTKYGGRGGRPLDYSTGRLFLGGGGGAGDQDNGFGGVGGAGGGLIYLLGYGTVSGTGSIVSNGDNGVQATGTPANNSSFAGQDGAGGGGAGGTIILNSTGTLSGVTLNANGGNGGNQNIVKGSFVFTVNGAEGPGGGGSGGYIAVSNTGLTQTVNGGANGTTNSNGLTEFIPNGATRGGAGTMNQSVSNYTITASNVTICSGATATLTSTITGTAPAGSVVTWYAAETGGTALGTGTTFTTPALTSTTTYYVGTCPGTYRSPVVVTVTAGLTVNVNPVNSSVCPGGNVTLTATGGTTYTWTPSASLSGTTGASVIAAPSSASTYTVTGTTGSCSDTAVAIVTINATPTVTVSPSSVSLCVGGNANLVAAGANTYTWSPAGGLSGTSGATVNAGPGSTTTYTVTGTNTAGCVDTAQAVVIVNSIPTVSITPPATTICSGTTTNLSASGASTYNWSPATGLSGTSGSMVSASPSSTITYTVTGTSSGCTDLETVVVTVNPTPSVGVSPSSVSVCAGGSVNLTGIGATTYTWSPATGLSSTFGSTVTSTPSSTITYTVTGTSGSCSDTARAIVTVLPVPSVTVSPTNTTICAGSVTTLTASGASTYNWTPTGGLTPSTGSVVSASPSSTSTYTVTGTNGSGCIDTAITRVTVTPLPVISVSPSAQTICSGGSAILSATGGSTYTWTPSATLSASSGASVTATPSVTTTYTVTGTQSGCTSSATSVISVSAAITIGATSSPDTICQGQTTTLFATGATNYTWSPATGLSGTTGSSVTATPSSTQTYTVIGTSGTCSDTTTVSVVVIPTFTVTASANQNPICPGSSATLTATGATTYSWSPSATLNVSTGSPVVASPASTTTYTVTGTTNGCTALSSIEVVVQPLPSISASPSSSLICDGGNVTILASGGSNYSWSPASSLSSGTGPSVTASPSSTTTYTVTGTQSGCSDTAMVVVEVSSALDVDVLPISSMICAGDSIMLQASGATTYSWNPSVGLSSSSGSSVNASPATTTTYTVTGTSGSCTDTSIAIVQVTGAITASVSGSPVICMGDSTTITATGGSSFAWSPSAGLSSTTGGTVNASPASTTTYTVIASSGTCSDTTTFELVVSPVPAVSVSSSDDTICSGTSASLTAIGATNYSWNPASSLSSGTGSTVIATPAVTTTYSVIGTDNGCSDTAEVVVNVLASPVVSVTTADDTLCVGESTQLIANGATTYTWDPPQGLSATTGSTVTADPSTTTTYSVIGSNGSCTDTATILVEVIVPDVTTSISSTMICEGDSAKVTPSGGQTYTWNPSTGVTLDPMGAYYLAPMATSTYTVTGTFFGCTDTAQVVVAVEPIPTLVLTATLQTICKGSSTSLSVSGANSYFWSPGQFVDDSTAANVVATPLSTTTFTVAGIMGNCGVIDTIIVNVIEVDVQVSTSSAIVCKGSNATLTASGASTYEWSPASSLSSTTGTSVTATPLSATTYTITGTDANGCTDTSFISLTVDSIPTANAGADITTCQSSVTLNAADPSPFAGVWSIQSGPGSVSSPNSPASSVSGLSAGTTVLTWTVTNTCGSASDDVTISSTGGPTATASASPGGVCPGESSTLTVEVTNGTAPYTYSWSDGGTGQSQSVSPSSTTSYSVQVTDANGCVSNTTQTSVLVHSPPSVDAGPDVTIVKGESTQLNASGASQYEWSPSSSLTSTSGANPTASPTETTEYTVTGTDANGCSATDQVVVSVEEKINVFVPQLFSPNGDGNNDVLYVRGGAIKEFKFVLFNRWGEKVFETEDLNSGWDGTFRGRPVDEGVFVFYLKGSYIDGSEIDAQGNITLIR